MEDKKLKKIGVAAVSASVLTVGTVAFVAAYQSGSTFNPSDSNRELQTNQVIFSDEDDSVGHKKNESKKNESQMLDKNQDQDSQSQPKAKSQADYLFENDVKLAENTKSSAMINDGNENTSFGNLLDDVAQTPGNKHGTILDITGDAGNADTIIHGGNGNGSGTGTGNGGNGTGSGNHVNGNNHGNPNNGSNKYTEISDPDSKKPAATDDIFTNRPFTETDVANKENPKIHLMQPGSASYCLYMGQQVTEKDIYNALDTYVLTGKGLDCVRYNWDENAYGKYVRIDSVSFDGGNTWENTFPLTIPEEMNQDTMLIKASYRLKEEEKWNEYVYDNELSGVHEEWISYEVKKACIFLMTEELPEGTSQIDETKVLTVDEQKYPDGETFSLFKYTDKLLKARGFGDTSESGTGKRIHALLPGWQENGVKVPWLYPITRGRHIIEPQDLVPLSDEYKAVMKNYWLDDNFQPDLSDGKLYNLQTMTDYEKKSLLGKSQKEYLQVDVPKHMQAVDMEEDADLKVEYLSVPDTVVYVNGSSQGLTVDQGYIVDEDNPYYTATDEGILTNKAEMEYQAIPAKIRELSVPENVTKVNLLGNNNVSVLKFKTDSIEQIPELEFSQTDMWGDVTLKGQNCEVIVKDALLNDFIEKNKEHFIDHNTSTGYANFKSIASEEEPDVVYTVASDGQVKGNNAALRKVIDTGRSTVQLNSDTKYVMENAFDGIASVNRLQMPDNGESIELEKNCFAGSSIKNILCYSEEQYNYVAGRLKESAAPEDIQVELVKLQTSQEGFSYYEETIDGENGAVLVKAPKELKEFAGQVTAEDGMTVTISDIADSAFAGCTDLTWVELPESVTTIGYGAFYGCNSLQGILIHAKEYIYIGNRSFDNCSSLRFVASNAMTAEMQDGYDPVISQMYNWTQMTYFYAPTNSTGYGEHALSFTPESGVEEYSMADISDNCKMLYGNSYADDGESYPWLGIRSGTNAGEQVELPVTTLELYSYSMADMKSSTGKYEINWSDLDQLQYFDEGVFYESDLGGDILLDQGSTYLSDYVFRGCREITNLQVTGQVTHLGNLVFEECEKLESVTLGSAGEDVSITANIFYGCNALRNLTLGGNYNEFKLTMQGRMPYQFNSAWTQEEEWETLHITIPYDPGHFYIKKWRFYLAGYREEYNAESGYVYPPYLDMWEGLYREYLWDYGEYPTYEQIDKEVEEKLVAAENGLRKMLGEEPVDEPTNFFPYRRDDNTLTLVGAPSNIEDAFLWGEMMEFPEGWSLDYIASGAFSKSKNLRSMTFIDNLAGIYPDIFSGVESDTVTMRFWTDAVPKLMIEKQGIPFDFGIDNSRIKLEINSGMGEAFINNWSYPLAGYSSRETMEEAVKAELTEKNGGTEPTEEELKTEVDLRILPYMNIVRGWIGLDPVQSFDAIGKGAEKIDSNDAVENAGESEDKDTKDDEQVNDILPDNTLTDEDTSGDDQAEDKSQTVTTEQREDVKKEESNFDSQD